MRGKACAIWRTRSWNAFQHCCRFIAAAAAVMNTIIICLRERKKK